MPVIRVSQSKQVPAPPGMVYAILADYTKGHAQILPRRYFSHLEIEQGGVGAGTIIRFQMHAFGSTQALRAEITEPVPGEVLVETISPTGAITTFRIVPESGGQASRVTISTDLEVKGLTGWIQSMVVPRFLRKVYSEELDNLASAVSTAL